MVLERVSPEEYGLLFRDTMHVFDSMEFNELNRNKCLDVHYLIFRDSKKVRLAIVLGERESVLKSPFSAPFGGIEEHGCQRLSYYTEIPAMIRDYGVRLGKRVLVTLPPPVYDGPSSGIAKQYCALLSGGATQAWADYNYHYDLREFSYFKDKLWPNVKRNLATAMRQDFCFRHFSCPVIDDIKDVYDIIRVNHESMGYPVHMSFDDVVSTRDVVDMDFFILEKDGVGIASAVIYHTSACGVQLIYWGDRPEYRVLRPMNMLSYKIIEHYSVIGKRFFDLGPASSDGIPAIGLCDFKEGLGCCLSVKPTLIL